MGYAVKLQRKGSRLQSKLIGTYSSNTTINVTSYNAKSVEEFIATSNGGSKGTTRYGNPVVFAGDCSGSGQYTAPTLSLSGTTLTLKVGVIRGRLFSSGSHVDDNQYGNLTTNVYYIGVLV